MQTHKRGIFRTLNTVPFETKAIQAKFPQR